MVHPSCSTAERMDWGRPLRQLWAGEWVAAAKRAAMRIQFLTLMTYSLALAWRLRHTSFGVAKKILS